MNRSLLTLSLAVLLAATQQAAAQWPAGTPREDTGSRPSPMGNPAPQQKLETHRNEQGQIVTEDGRPVKGMPENDSVPNRNMHRTEQETVTEDPPHRSATPGELE
ncbi:MAG: hypothetical protein IE938_15305 [Pseudomonas balearica]|uniref:hypothetical protein n=1 Tax=Stutzerimonas balearica TaxID=74829 RepID=UPI000B28D99C|nr:hypothetical protein [Stutzerimonas balearica]MBD3737805.1 hypothetical protein [Stutzerimonas balearica]MCZ4127798.1 hypothetical protein [Stutzerimonas balearica]WIX04508.1 hypothetical protein QK899_08865 [Pseudomonas sp. AR5]